ncbi:hypothetical protein ES703_119010 [subsurface metagenome]
MPVANPDLFSCYKNIIYMGPQKIDLKGKRVTLEVEKGKEKDQMGEGRHLFCPTEFLDEAWFHRSYFIYGKNAGEGHGEYGTARGFTHVGRIMVFDKENVYSFYAHNVGNNLLPRTSYMLYSAEKDDITIEEQAPKKKKEGAETKKKKKKKKGKGKKVKVRMPHIWEMEPMPLLANAMVSAGGNLFLAGPPDVADEEKTEGILPGRNDDINRQMAKQEEAWLGKYGAKLLVVSSKQGKKLAEYDLKSIPVWDGMAAAGGRLFMSHRDGKVTCWEE